MNTDLLIFVIGMAVYGVALLRNTVLVRSTVLSGHREVREGGVRGAVRSALPEVLLFTLLAVLASLRADLRSFWAVAAILLGAMSGMTVFFAYFARLPAAPEGAVPETLSTEYVEALVARRRALSPFIIAMILAWIYSWRGSFGSG